MPHRRYEVPDKPFITTADMRVRYGPDFDPNVFGRWVREGKVRKLRNGLYLQTSYPERALVDAFAVANRLYEHSYVSLITALHYHALIPEMVYHVTSVSTQTTRRFVVGSRKYIYRQIGPKLFSGFEEMMWNGTTYRMARPEKAFVDLAYLEPRFSDPAWIEEMRFDSFTIEEDLDVDRMRSYAKATESRTVVDRIELLLKVSAL